MKRWSFWTLLKAIQTLDVENFQKYLKSEKIATANILQEEKSIRSQHKLFREKSKKRNRPGKYQRINDICGNDLSYQRCFASNIYPNGPMLKEEVMAIKESLKHSRLDQFRASDGWLDTQKSAYAIKERQIVGEAGDVAEETVTSWMERIQKLTEWHSSENIWNMDKSVFF